MPNDRLLIGVGHNRGHTIEARVDVEIAMDEMLDKITTPDSCERFAVNVEARWPERAQAARVKAVKLPAKAHGATSDAECEALEAVHAYERVLSVTRGKKIAKAASSGGWLAILS